MKEAFLIEGMTCSGCERTIQQALMQLDGLNDARPDFRTSSLEIEYNPEKITIDQVKKAVEHVGYRIVDKKPPEWKPRDNDPVG